MTRLVGCLIDNLLKISPGFPLKPSDITILHSAEQFHETLKNNISASKRRIIISALYIGDGPRERLLVDLIGERMGTQKNLRTSILLDFARFYRGNEIVSQLERFNARFKLCLLCPSLINLGEFWGVQHIKYYITDDTVILSGANLSSSYLSDRLDRYIVIRDCPQLIGFLQELHGVIEDNSAKLGSLRGDLEELFGRHKTENVSGDIVIFPFVQLGRFGIRMEEDFFRTFFHSVKRAESLFLSTAYFNPPDSFLRSLRDTSPNLSVITSSPRANSFFGERGVKGFVVPLYEEFQKGILESCRLFQWGESGGHTTFHSKGLWAFGCQQVGGGNLTVAVVGSSNFGMRSFYRDLELQMVLVTNNERFEEELRKEVESVFEGGRPVSSLDSSEAPLPIYYRPFVFLFKSFF